MTTPGSDVAVPANRSITQVLKDIALFFAAPMVTLAYLPLFPFIGLRMLRQTRRRPEDAA
jgi:hypothetical protein